MSKIPAAAGPTSGLARLRTSSTMREKLEAEGLGELDELSTDNDVGSEQPETAITVKRHPARETIIAAALRRSCPAQERKQMLASSRPIAVIIKVPSASWIHPVESYVKKLKPQWKIIARDGSIRSADKPSIGCDIVADALAAGRSVVGISCDPKTILPASLTAGADHIVTVPAPDASLMRLIMRRRGHQGPDTDAFDDRTLLSLDLDDLVAALRDGFTVSECSAALRRAASRRTSTATTDMAPNLETAFEFGAMRTFGLDMASDIIGFKSGNLKWKDCVRGGVIFGPPGTGKSTAPASVAQMANVPLLKYSIGDFFAKGDAHLGTVLQAQRSMFEEARRIAPCLLQIDELDVLPERASLDRRNRDWWLPIVNDFLIQLDSSMGDETRAGIFILATTNFIDRIDSAIMRPGRLERAIEIGTPDLPGTINVLRHHLGTELSDIDISGVALLVQGDSAAELMDVVRTAKRIARRAGRDLELADLEAAALGDDEISQTMLWRLAVHEAGHAIAVIATGGDELVHIALRTRGRSGGHMRVEPNDEDLPTLGTIEKQVVSILAAGCAEESIIGEVSTGWGGSPESDLGQCSIKLSIAHASTGILGKLLHHGDSEDALAAVRANPELRRDVEAHLQRLRNSAIELVARHKSRIVAVAQALFERRFLPAATIVDLISGIPQDDESCGAKQYPAPRLVEPNSPPATHNH